MRSKSLSGTSASAAPPGPMAMETCAPIPMTALGVSPIKATVLPWASRSAIRLRLLDLDCPEYTVPIPAFLPTESAVSLSFSENITVPIPMAPIIVMASAAVGFSFSSTETIPRIFSLSHMSTGILPIRRIISACSAASGQWPSFLGAPFIWVGFPIMYLVPFSEISILFPAGPLRLSSAVLNRCRICCSSIWEKVQISVTILSSRVTMFFCSNIRVSAFPMFLTISSVPSSSELPLSFVPVSLICLRAFLNASFFSHTRSAPHTAAISAAPCSSPCFHCILPFTPVTIIHARRTINPAPANISANLPFGLNPLQLSFFFSGAIRSAASPDRDTAANTAPPQPGASAAADNMTASDGSRFSSAFFADNAAAQSRNIL